MLRARETALRRFERSAQADPAIVARDFAGLERRNPTKDKASSRLSTGVAGLDEILCGGLLPGRAYLVRGGPGSGKTTLGLHFLTAGAANGEKVLFITLGEPEEQIRKNAAGLALT